MEITLSRQDLLRELSAVQSVVERKNTIPILSNILFEADANHSLTITATDLDQAMRTACPAKVKTPGTVAIPARKLYDYVKLLGNGDVTLKLLDNNWIQIRSGRSHTKMVSMAATNFPKFATLPAAMLKLPAASIRSILGKITFAISNEESRHTLNGALLIVKAESICLVSTDGHRLSHIDINAPIHGFSGEKRLLIPRKALLEVQNLLNSSESDTPLEFSDDESTLFFRFAGRVLTSRKLTGTFPNYEAVLPRENTKVAVVRTRELTSAIMRVGQFTDDRSQSLKLKLDKNELTISGSSSEVGESEETLDTTYAHDPISICFNAGYVRDFLKAVGDTETVKLIFKDAQTAGEMIPGEALPDIKYRHIIMPMRGA